MRIKLNCKAILPFCLIITCHNIYSQSAITKETIVGKWNICYRDAFDRNFVCSDSTWVYQFNADGSFVQNGDVIVMNDIFHYTGKWTLTGKTLHLKFDTIENKGGAIYGRVQDIQMQKIDSNTYYESAYEGPKKKKKYLIYIYYQKIE